jgi:hypothetical protein
MRACCPPGHGCNAEGDTESCALELCRSAAGVQKDAALALKRWGSLEQALERGRGERECRFRRRAFERARDRALIALALTPEPAADAASQPEGAPAGWRGRRRLRPRGRKRAMSG